MQSNQTKIHLILFWRRNTKLIRRTLSFLVLAMLFFVSLIFVVSRIIDFPLDNKNLVSLEEISGGEFEPKWHGCTSFQNIQTYKFSSDEDKEILKNVCFVKTYSKDSRFFANALNLDSTVLTRKICILGDAELIPEQERKDGTSIWDIREYGALDEDGKCLILNNGVDSQTYLPIKFFPGFQKNTLERTLVYRNQTVLVVYLLSFLFTVYIWKTIFEAIKFCMLFFRKSTS